MSFPIPPKPALTLEQKLQRVQQWHTMREELKPARDAEAATRREVIGMFFDTLEEGSNRCDLQNGFELVAKGSVTRSVDEALLDNVSAAKFKKLKINPDKLFPTKRVLDTRTYRTLTEEQREFVDGLLIIKDDGLPGLELRALQKEEAATPEEINVCIDHAKVVPGGYFLNTQDGTVWQWPEGQNPAWVAINDSYVIAQVVQAAERAALIPGTPSAPPPPPAPAATPASAAPSISTDMATTKPGQYFLDGNNQWWFMNADGSWVESADPTAQAAQPQVAQAPATEAAKKAPPKKQVAQKIVSIEDPDVAEPGDYYCDDNNQWWHVDDNGDWEEIDDPNAAPKKTRGRGRSNK